MTLKNFKLQCGIMKVGNSTVMVLPKSLCENFGFEKGQVWEVIYTQQGLLIPSKVNKELSKKFIRKENKKKVKVRY